MGRRYSVEWIVLWLLVGAMLAIASHTHGQSANVTGIYNTNTGASDIVGAQALAGDVPANLPDGSYSWAVRGTLAGSPGGCSGQTATYHPGFSKSGATVTWSCADCDEANLMMKRFTMIYGMPCYSGGTMTFTSTPPANLPAGFSGNSPTWTITRQDQASGGGGTVIAQASLSVSGSTCSEGVTVTGHWVGGAPHAADVVINVMVNGFLAQVQCDANGCNSGTFSAAQLNLVHPPPYDVQGGGDPSSWAICGPPGARYKANATVDGIPDHVACGGTINANVHSNCSPSATPSPSPSASIAPEPSTTPVVSPSPAPTPLTFTTPEPNSPGTPVTNGGVTGSGISNQDIYNDVKQALQDAGNSGEWGAANGSFGYGNDPSGEDGSAGNGLQDAVNRFTNDLEHGGSDSIMGKIDAIDSLDLPTGIGDKATWSINLPVLGDLSVDATAYNWIVYPFRSLCLGILIVGAWFAMIKIIRSGVA